MRDTEAFKNSVACAACCSAALAELVGPEGGVPEFNFFTLDGVEDSPFLLAQWIYYYLDDVTPDFSCSIIK